MKLWTTSMNILPEIQQKIQKEIFPYVQTKWHPMLELGINALSLCPFKSLNENARKNRENEKAAEMQMYRLSRHPKLLKIFSILLTKLFKVTDQSIINVDFSIFHPFAILCFALQTESGRSIPIWVDIIKYPVEEDSQNLFVLDTLAKFIKVIDCSPNIVCDRGFIGENLIGGFLLLNLTFYLRMKADKYITYNGKRLQVREKKKKLKNIHWLDVTGELYVKLPNLRAVRSSKSMKQKVKAKECWYIVTNDMETTREDILRTYYYRFEIEETFKDIKHAFDTNPRYIIKKRTLKTILLFQILGIWLLWEINQVCKQIRETYLKQRKRSHSWIRQNLELVLKERLLPVIPSYSPRKEVSLA